MKGLRYPVGKLTRDIPVAYEVLKRAARVAWIGNVDYYYFQRAASIQNAAFDPKKLDGVEHCRAMLENVRQDHPSVGTGGGVPLPQYAATSCSVSGTRPTSRSVNCLEGSGPLPQCGGAGPHARKSAAGGAAFLWRLSAAALCVWPDAVEREKKIKEKLNGKAAERSPAGKRAADSAFPVGLFSEPDPSPPSVPVLR